MMQTQEDLLDAFDAAWARTALSSSSLTPGIQDYRLPEGSSAEHQHFEDLVEIDLTYRWQRAAGTRNHSETCTEFPSLGDYVAVVSKSGSTAIFSPALVAEAYQLALQSGQSANHEDFLPYAKDAAVARQLLSEVDANRDTPRTDSGTPNDPPAVMTSLPNHPDYVFETVLGRGGKGIVYKARQISINRSVAIKTLRATGDTSANDIRRLRNEAKILGSLNHPNIVTVYCLDQTDVDCFLVMEYVSGSDLSVHQKNGTISHRDAARYMLTAAKAIAAAHEHGILHRDIKPSNILLDDDGTIRVTDFGLSRRRQRDENSAPLTVTAEVLGTPGYISPEQARGQSRDLDERADVYGIGATLYALLVGIAPFTGQDVLSILRQVCERTPTPPRMLQPDIPRDLQTICLKCLEKQPADRYPSAKAVAEDLNRFLCGEPIQARPSGMLLRTIRWCQRNVALAALLCSVILLTMTSVGIFIVRSVENVKALATMTQQKLEIEQTLKRETAVVQELRDNQVRLAGLEYGQNRLDNMEHILISDQRDHAPDNAPPWEWSYLNGLLNASEHRWEMPAQRAEWIGAVAYSPDGSLIAIGNRAPNFDNQPSGAKGRITIRNIMTGNIVVQFDDLMSITDLLFTEDGTTLMAVESDIGVSDGFFRFGAATIRQWDTESWQELSFIETDAQFHQVHPTDDGKLIAFAYATDEAAERLLLFNPDYPCCPMAFYKWELSPTFTGFQMTLPDDRSEVQRVTRNNLLDVGVLSGNRFEISVADTWEDGRATVFVRSKPGGELIRTIDVPFVETMAIDSAEQRLAIATRKGEIRVWNTETWVESPPFRGHRNQIKSLVFSPDSTKMASGDWDGKVRIWDLSKPPERTDTGYPARDAALESFALNGEGNLVTFIAGGSLEVFAPGSKSPLHTQNIPFPQRRLSPGRLADMNADGTLVAVASSRDGKVVQIHFTANGEIMNPLAAHGTRVSFVRFMGDLIGTAAWGSRLSEPPLPDDGEIRLSDLKGNEIFFTKVDAARVYRLALSSDAQMVAASIEQYAEDGTSNDFVRVWSVPTGEQIDEFSLDHWALALEFHPINDLLTAIGFDTGDMTIRDVRQTLTVFHQPDSAPEVQDLAFSPDGTRLAAATRRQLRLWNFDTRRQILELLLKEFEGDFSFNSRVRFTADGKAIISNQTDGTIRSWGQLGKSN